MLARSGVQELIAGCGSARVLPVIPQARRSGGGAICPCRWSLPPQQHWCWLFSPWASPLTEVPTNFHPTEPPLASPRSW